MKRLLIPDEGTAGRIGPKQFLGNNIQASWNYVSRSCEYSIRGNSRTMQDEHKFVPVNEFTNFNQSSLCNIF